MHGRTAKTVAVDLALMPIVFVRDTFIYRVISFLLSHTENSECWDESVNQSNLSLVLAAVLLGSNRICSDFGVTFGFFPLECLISSVSTAQSWSFTTSSRPRSLIMDGFSENDNARSFDSASQTLPKKFLFHFCVLTNLHVCVCSGLIIVLSFI